MPPITLLSVAHCGSLYGANRSLYDLLTALPADKVRPRVIFLEDGPAATLFKEAGIPVELFTAGLSSHQSGGSLERWKYDARPYSAKWFVRAAQRFGADSRRGQSLVAKLGHLERTVIHSNSSVIDFGWRLSRKLGCPHLWHLREYGEADFGLLPDFGLSWQRGMMARSTSCIAISENVRHHFGGSGDSGFPCRVIYNGVRTRSDFAAGFAERQRLPRDASQPVRFLMTSAIHQGKGHETAIRAFAQAAPLLGKAEFLIAGDGGGRQRMEALVNSLNLANKVRFLGYLQDVRPWILQADALLMCSESEAMGRATVEAMGYGTPVIGNATGGTVEIIQNGTSGFLYDGSMDDLARKMNLVPRTGESASQLAQNCHRSARDRFAIEAYAERFLEALLELPEMSNRR